MRHHPEWSNSYRKIIVRWTTHNPQGLSGKDVYMASICDTFAAEFGETKLNNEGMKDVRNGFMEEQIPAGEECEPCSAAKKE